MGAAGRLPDRYPCGNGLAAGPIVVEDNNIAGDRVVHGFSRGHGRSRKFYMNSLEYSYDY